MTSAPPDVRVGVGVFILKSCTDSPDVYHFLLGKRLSSHGSGTFALPGGHLEFSESPEECASREVLEETGLKVQNVRFLTATNDYMPAEGKHYITLFTVCELQQDGDEARVMEPDKCEGWEWVSWESLLGWVEENEKADDEAVLERRLFVPLINLISQRPGVVPTLA